MFKQQQDQLIGGCEGLYLSFLVYRLNEELMKIMEIKRKPKLTLK